MLKEKNDSLNKELEELEKQYVLSFLCLCVEDFYLLNVQGHS